MDLTPEEIKELLDYIADIANLDEQEIHNEMAKQAGYSHEVPNPFHPHIHHKPSF